MSFILFKAKIIVLDTFYMDKMPPPALPPKKSCTGLCNRKNMALKSDQRVNPSSITQFTQIYPSLIIINGKSAIIPNHLTGSRELNIKGLTHWLLLNIYYTGSIFFNEVSKNTNSEIFKKDYYPLRFHYVKFIQFDTNSMTY